MNRYHLGIIYCLIAFSLGLIVYVRHIAVMDRYEADKEVKLSMNFAMNNAVMEMRDSYGTSNQMYRVSDVFFNSLAAIRVKESVLNGRIAPEDYYVYVPCIVYLVDKGYYVGTTDRFNWTWSELKFYPDKRTLSSFWPNEVDTIKVLVETLITDSMKEYHDTFNMPDKQYTFVDEIRFGEAPPVNMILCVLENFPTIVDGYFYDGVLESSGYIRNK